MKKIDKNLLVAMEFETIVAAPAENAMASTTACTPSKADRVSTGVWRVRRQV